MKLIAPYNIDGVERASTGELLEWLQDKERVGLDIETIANPEYLWYDKAGLDPYTSLICTIQIGNADEQGVIDTRFIDPTKILRKIHDNGIRIVGVNLKFDLQHIMHHYDIRFEKTYDAMLAEMVIHCGGKRIKGFYSLRGMSERYLDIEVEKEIRTEFREWGFKPLTYELIKYGAQDIVLPLYIAEKQLPKIAAAELQECIKLEHKFLPILAEIELNGMYLDVDLWLENEAKYHKKLDEKLQALQELVPDVEINGNSPKQVIELFQQFDIPTKIVDKDKSTDSKTVYKHSVGKAHLGKYREKYPLVKRYLEYKELQKLISSYGEKFLRHINPVSGRIHTSFYQILDTGRLSSSPNQQNIPGERTPGFRESYIAPEKCYMVVGDYSAQESRILADYAKEPAMIDFFLNGDGDLHSLTARRMFNCEVSKTVRSDLRYKGKVTNFAVSYGAGPHKLADTFQITMKEAKDLIDKYYTAYPALDAYFEKEKAKAVASGYVLIDDVTKRRSYHSKYLEYKLLTDNLKANGKKVPADIWGGLKKTQAAIERMAMNYRIQGTAASMTKLAVILFDEAIKYCGLRDRVKIVNIVHDEIVVQAEYGTEHWASETLQECMETAGKVFVKSVPMIAEPKISSYWTH